MKKIKKIFIVLISLLVIENVCFAQKNTFGLDVVFGIPLGFSTLTSPANAINNDVKIKFTEIDIGMKAQTYDCFLLNGLLGVYASAAFGVGFGIQSEKSDGTMVIDDGGIIISGDFMIGPAIGININKLRLQTGVAFHAVLVNLNSLLFDGEHKNFQTIGFALTPQLRFNTDKRFCFLVGIDFMFDFPNEISNTDSFDATTTVKYESGFRFGCTPYLGIGINFGKL